MPKNIMTSEETAERTLEEIIDDELIDDEDNGVYAIVTEMIDGMKIKLLYQESHGRLPFPGGEMVSLPDLAKRVAEARRLCPQLAGDLIDVAVRSSYREWEDSAYGEIIHSVLSWEENCRRNINSYDPMWEWDSLYEVLAAAGVNDLIHKVMTSDEVLSEENHELMAALDGFMSFCGDDLVYGAALEASSMAETETHMVREVFLPNTTDGIIYVLVREC